MCCRKSPSRGDDGSWAPRNAACEDVLGRGSPPAPTAKHCAIANVQLRSSRSQNPLDGNDPRHRIGVRVQESELVTKGLVGLLLRVSELGPRETAREVQQEALPVKRQAHAPLSVRNFDVPFSAPKAVALASGCPITASLTVIPNGVREGRLLRRFVGSVGHDKVHDSADIAMRDGVTLRVICEVEKVL